MRGSLHLVSIDSLNRRGQEKKIKREFFVDKITTVPRHSSSTQKYQDTHIQQTAKGIECKEYSLLQIHSITLVLCPYNRHEDGLLLHRKLCFALKCVYVSH